MGDVLVTRGVMSTMYLGARHDDDWRRHLQLVLEGLVAADRGKPA